MARLRSLLKVSAMTLLVSQPFFISPAFAAGFQINEISPGLQGDATAGAAAADNDVSAMFINPATLSNLRQNQAYLGASEILPHVRMESSSAVHTANIPGLPPSSITAPVSGVASQNSVARPAFVPDGYISWRISDRLVAGLSIVAPFGLVTKYNSDSVVRFSAVDSSLATIDINPALAFKVNDQWSLGVGLQAQHTSATFTNFNGPYTGVPSIDALIAPTQPTYLTASGWGYGYTLGAMFTPYKSTRVGLGYRSMLSNQLSGNGQQNTSAGGIVPAPTTNFPFNAQTSVKGAIRTPAVLTLSAAQDINAWTLKATAQMNFWNSFNHLSINMPDAYATNATYQTKWSNTWFGALGADYRPNCDWTLRAGVAYDETPTNNTYREPRIPDNDRYWLTFGASYAMTKHLSVDGAYEHIFSPNQSVNVTQATGTSSLNPTPAEVNTVNAKYNSSVDILALAVRYSF